MGFIAITIIANMRGLNDSAAVGIVEKIIGILFLVPSTLLSTVSALAALNIGAGEHGCVRQILLYAVAMAVGYGLVIGVTMQFAADGAVSLFARKAEVIRLGGEYLRGYAWDCLFAGIHFASAASFARMVCRAFRFCITSSRSFARACRLPIWLPHWIKPA